MRLGFLTSVPSDARPAGELVPSKPPSVTHATLLAPVENWDLPGRRTHVTRARRW